MICLNVISFIDIDCESQSPTIVPKISRRLEHGPISDAASSGPAAPFSRVGGGDAEIAAGELQVLLVALQIQPQYFVGDDFANTRNIMTDIARELLMNHFLDP